MKDRDILDIVYGLQYERQGQGFATTRYGEKGDTFYIILKGKCSVWLPVPADKNAVVAAKVFHFVNQGFDQETSK